MYTTLHEYSTCDQSDLPIALRKKQSDNRTIQMSMRCIRRKAPKEPGSTAPVMNGRYAVRNLAKTQYAFHEMIRTISRYFGLRNGYTKPSINSLYRGRVRIAKSRNARNSHRSKRPTNITPSPNPRAENASAR